MAQFSVIMLHYECVCSTPVTRSSNGHVFTAQHVSSEGESCAWGKKH